MNRFLSILICLCIATTGFAQDTHFKTRETIQPGYEAYVFELADQDMKAALSSAPLEGMALRQDLPTMTLPMPDGSVHTFQVMEAPVMAPALSAKFPEIHSYKVIAEGMNGRIGYTHKGFHGMIFTNKGTVYIDPIGTDEGVYHAYYRQDYMAFYQWTKGHTCLMEDEVAASIHIPESYRGGRSSGDKLRTYRLALACTGEYGTYHGGTVSGALSAMVISMNRVNGVYERDCAITMQLIGNNDDIIYLNGGSDPYSNNNGFSMLGQNQSNLANVIGLSNFDIGHVFSTGGGGVASLGSVCSNNSKARGVTGSSAPTGDPFDIDYVAHEIGHQFGGEHTFNSTSGSCGGGNREGSSAYEPGSGSTIMAYAGICGSQDNLQNNSDDYFHVHSLEQIHSFSQFGNGNTCAAITNTGNSIPTADAGSSGYTIPKETPFLLTGSGTDGNGDNLTYCWEQMDLGPGGTITSPSGDAPIFRSWDPTTDDTRTCPRLVNVIIGNTVKGETYPTYSRDMTFRLTVRDQNSAGGGVDWDEMSFDVDGNAGPFVVTSPQSGEQVEAENAYVVTWDVAGTDAAPINCQSVTIELCIYNTSTQTLTILETLAASTPNDGSEAVTISAANTGGGRYIRVKAVNNIFFNLNGGSFSVIPASAPEDFGITLTATPDAVNQLVKLNWTDSFNNESKFMIERSLGNNQNFVLIDSVGANVTTYDDLSANMYGSNFYRVYAKNSAGQSDYSNEATYQGLSVENPLAKALSLYPNPVLTFLHVEWPVDQALTHVSIRGTKGEYIRDVDIASAGKTRIDLSTLPAGQYWLQVETSSGQTAVRSFQVAK